MQALYFSSLFTDVSSLYHDGFTVIFNQYSAEAKLLIFTIVGCVKLSHKHFSLGWLLFNLSSTKTDNFCIMIMFMTNLKNLTTHKPRSKDVAHCHLI